MIHLPFEANANIFASFFGRKHRQRRSSLRKHALTRIEVKTIAMVVATQLDSVEQLSGRLQIRLFVRTLPRKRKIFPLDERQQHLTSAEVDFFHDTRC